MKSKVWICLTCGEWNPHQCNCNSLYNKLKKLGRTMKFSVVTAS